MFIREGVGVGIGKTQKKIGLFTPFYQGPKIGIRTLIIVSVIKFTVLSQKRIIVNRQRNMLLKCLE